MRSSLVKVRRFIKFYLDQRIQEDLRPKMVPFHLMHSDKCSQSQVWSCCVACCGYNYHRFTFGRVWTCIGLFQTKFPSLRVLKRYFHRMQKNRLERQNSTKS